MSSVLAKMCGMEGRRQLGCCRCASALAHPEDIDITVMQSDLDLS